MRESGDAGRETSAKSGPIRLEMPPDIERRVAAWFDVRAAGETEFWRWFRAVLPLLPGPAAAGVGERSADAPRSDRVQELARDLVECAGERARLTIAADQYFRDNQAIARRLKTLESTLRILKSRGRGVPTPPDDEATEAAGRYLPSR